MAACICNKPVNILKLSSKKFQSSILIRSWQKLWRRKQSLTFRAHCSQFWQSCSNIIKWYRYNKYLKVQNCFAPDSDKIPDVLFTLRVQCAWCVNADYNLLINVAIFSSLASSFILPVNSKEFL